MRERERERSIDAHKIYATTDAEQRRLNKKEFYLKSQVPCHRQAGQKCCKMESKRRGGERQRDNAFQAFLSSEKSFWQNNNSSQGSDIQSPVLSQTACFEILRPSLFPSSFFRSSRGFGKASFHLSWRFPVLWQCSIERGHFLSQRGVVTPHRNRFLFLLRDSSAASIVNDVAIFLQRH